MASMCQSGVLHMKKDAYFGAILAVFGSMILLGKAGAGSVDPDNNATAPCKTLASTDFTHIQDAPTQIMTAESIDAVNDGVAYCRVEGYVAPQVGFEVRLPLSNWNHKLLVRPHGGWGGALHVEL